MYMNKIVVSWTDTFVYSIHLGMALGTCRDELVFLLN